MGHEELKEIGINAYGHRHKLIKGVERLLGGQQGEGGQHHTHTHTPRVLGRRGLWRPIRIQSVYSECKQGPSHCFFRTADWNGCCHNMRGRKDTCYGCRCLYCTVAVYPGANPYLTFHCASQGTVLIDLAPDDKEYQSVEEEVSSPQNSTQWVDDDR